MSKYKFKVQESKATEKIRWEQFTTLMS